MTADRYGTAVPDPSAQAQQPRQILLILAFRRAFSAARGSPGWPCGVVGVVDAEVALAIFLGGKVLS